MKKKPADTKGKPGAFVAPPVGAPTVPMPQPQAQRLSIEQALAFAAQHQEAGRLAQGEEILRKILQAHPNHGPALHLLGINAHYAGNKELAADLIGRAVKVNPNIAIFHANLSEILRQLERLDQAVEHGKRAVAIDPRLLAGHGNLGIAYFDLGEFDKAEACHKAALAINPNFPSSLNNMGSILRERKDFDGAMEYYRRATQAKPDYLEPWNNLGATLTQNDRPEEGIAVLKQALQRNPNYAEAHCNMGYAFVALEKYQQAMTGFETALRFRPDYPEAYAGIARVWRESHNLEKAEAAAKKSLELDPDAAETHSVLGSIYISKGYPDVAADCFRKALEVDPECSSGTMGLGNILVEEGKFKEAEALFRTVMDRPGELPGALFSIAQTKKIKPGDELITLLETEAENISSLPETKACFLHFALGKLYDDLGDADRAFPHFIAGCAIKRKKLQYDSDYNTEYMRRIERVFSRDFLDKNRGHGDSSKLPIFVLGMPRSGTTLTEQIIASHPSVFGAGELFDFIHLAHKRENDSGPEFPESALNVTPLKLKEIGRKYAGGLQARDPKAAHVTDKMPSNFLNIGLIHLALPNAKIVHVNRNPLDTCISCFTRYFAHNQNQTYELNELGRYYRSYKDLMKHWRSVLPKDAFYDVQYEALVDDTENEARRLIEYCGLEWDDSCLAFYEHKRNVRTASVHQVRQPIYKTSVARWKKYEKFLGPLIEGLGDAFAE